MRSLVVSTLILFSAPAFAASDPDDAEGSHDHKDIPRFPGFYTNGTEQNDYNEIEMIVEWDKETNEEKMKPLAGKYFKTAYQLKEGARQPSVAELIKNYENAFKKKGAKVITRGYSQHDGKATFSMPVGKSQRWVHVNVYNSGDGYDITVLDEAAMEQKVELSASEMKDQLDANGFVALYGIQFDTGKDAIKPESEPLLEEIAKLLSDNADLQLAVEGHTDDVGQKKANEKLSKARAESVKKWLVKKGVSGKRLSAAGHGDSKPIADNRTEDGRAKNRRVELVKKK